MAFAEMENEEVVTGVERPSAFDSKLFVDEKDVDCRRDGIFPIALSAGAVAWIDVDVTVEGEVIAIDRMADLLRQLEERKVL